MGWWKTQLSEVTAIGQHFLLGKKIKTAGNLESKKSTVILELVPPPICSSYFSNNCVLFGGAEKHNHSHMTMHWKQCCSVTNDVSSGLQSKSRISTIETK